MARTVTAVDELQEYIQTVIGKAEHHARGKVDEIVPAIAGAIVWKKDDDLKVMEHEGKMANVLWTKISGKRYALSYNHELGQIEVRQGTTHGAVLASFSNSTPLAEVKRFFTAL